MLFCVISVFILSGNSISLVNFNPEVSGGSLIAPHRFSVSGWWDLVRVHRATWINMVPTIIAYLLNAANAKRKHRFPRVRFGRSASAPLPPQQHRAFERTFGAGRSGGLI